MITYDKFSEIMLISCHFKNWFSLVAYYGSHPQDGLGDPGLRVSVSWYSPFLLCTGLTCSIHRMLQTWRCVASKAGWQNALGLPSCSSWVTCFGGCQLPYCQDTQAALCSWIFRLPSPWLPSRQQPPGRPWARTTQPSHSQIPDRQKLWEDNKCLLF